MQAMFNIQAATLKARERTGDKTISTNVKNGLISVVRVTYKKNGVSTVTPIAGPMTADKAIEALNAI